VKRLLITGGSGVLGRVFTNKLSDRYQVISTFHNTIVPCHRATFAKMDITDYRDVGAVFREFKPEIVIHTAALANVDECEKNPHEAWQINEAGTENVSIFCRELKAKLVYISTDSVYDGSTGIHKEDEKLNPINVYAKTKLIGEHKALISKDYLILRLAYFDRLANWVVDSLRKHKEISMYRNVYFSPISAVTLTNMIVSMCDKNLSGIYNVGCQGSWSKYEFGVELAKTMELDAELIQRVMVEYGKDKVPRPENLSLDYTKVEHDLGIKMPSLRAELLRYKGEI